MDCAGVLEQLKELSPTPHKYRICKELKARTTKQISCKDLWLQVLKKGTSEQRIDQFDYDQLPKPKKIKESNKLEFGSKIDHCDSMYSNADQSRSMYSNKLNSNADQWNSNVRSNMDGQIEFVKCQNSIRALAELGYELTPLVNGKWMKSLIKKWRIVATDDLKPTAGASVAFDERNSENTVDSYLF